MVPFYNISVSTEQDKVAPRQNREIGGKTAPEEYLPISWLTMTEYGYHSKWSVKPGRNPPYIYLYPLIPLSYLSPLPLTLLPISLSLNPNPSLTVTMTITITVTITIP